MLDLDITDITSEETNCSTIPFLEESLIMKKIFDETEESTINRYVAYIFSTLFFTIFNF